MKKNDNYQYLISLYSSVDEYLSGTSSEEKQLQEMIVAFCTTVERILKIQLYKRNPILIYEIKNNDDLLVTVAQRKKLGIETITFNAALGRYRLLHKRSFSDDEALVLGSIYKDRNHLLHSHDSDNTISANKDDIVKKMGTVWGKIANLAEKTFGKKLIKSKKPKLRYTEAQLEDVLKEEVRKKIEKRSGIDDKKLFTMEEDYFVYGEGERCPRCGKHGFSIDGLNDSKRYLNNSPYYSLLLEHDSNLYKCKSCQLELTRKEYEMAKEIIRNNILYSSLHYSRLR